MSFYEKLSDSLTDRMIDTTTNILGSRMCLFV